MKSQLTLVWSVATLQPYSQRCKRTTVNINTDEAHINIIITQHTPLHRPVEQHRVYQRSGKVVGACREPMSVVALLCALNNNPFCSFYKWHCHCYYSTIPYIYIVHTTHCTHHTCLIEWIEQFIGTDYARLLKQQANINAQYPPCLYTIVYMISWPKEVSVCCAIYRSPRAVCCTRHVGGVMFAAQSSHHLVRYRRRARMYTKRCGGMRCVRIITCYIESVYGTCVQCVHAYVCNLFTQSRRAVSNDLLPGKHTTNMHIHTNTHAQLLAPGMRRVKEDTLCTEKYARRRQSRGQM